MSELSINTTQNVRINFKAASVGERLLASLLDLAIKGAYIIVISYCLKWIGIFRLLESIADDYSKAAIMIIFYFPVLIYSIVLESVFEGQTLGKRILKIKVVKIDGYQAGFGDYLIRWLFRIIENNFMAGIIGIITMVVNSKVQRLGDIAAGTAVITLKNKINISSTILEDIGTQYVPTYSQVIKLSDNDMRIIKETFQQARKTNDYETLRKLTLKIETVTGIVNQSGNQPDFIRTILKDYNYYTQNM